MEELYAIYEDNIDGGKYWYKLSNIPKDLYDTLCKRHFYYNYGSIEDDIVTWLVCNAEARSEAPEDIQTIIKDVKVENLGCLITNDKGAIAYPKHIVLLPE